MRNLPLLSVLVVMLCGRPAPSSDPVRAYPLGIEHSSAVGGKKTGWVSLTHRVERLPSGEYRYTYKMAYHGGRPRVGIRWEVLANAGFWNQIVLTPGEVWQRKLYSLNSPVWQQGEIDVFQFRQGGDRYVYRQSGPVPAGTHGKNP